MDGGLALSSHKPKGNFFPPHSSPATKTRMEKSLCMLPAVLFLGLLTHGAAALINTPAPTKSYALINYTTTTRPTLNWTEAVTVKGESRDGTTPATAEPDIFTTTVRDKQLDTTDTSKERNKKEKDPRDRKTEDDKSKLGRKKIIHLVRLLHEAVL